MKGRRLTLFLEMESLSHYVVQAGLELAILLSPSSVS
jgi:hypothetical protein